MQVDATRHGIDVSLHMLAASVDLFRFDRFIIEEPVCHADGAELEAVGIDDITGLPNQEFGASASDVDEQDLLVEYRQGLQNSQVDQPCFLEAGNYFDLNACLLLGTFQKGVFVDGFAHGAGSHGTDVCLRDFRNLTKALQGVNAPVHGVIFQNLHVFRSGSQANDFLFLGQDLEPVRVLEFDDYQMERIGSDINCG